MTGDTAQDQQTLLTFLDQLESRITSFTLRTSDERAVFSAQVKKLMKNEKEYKKRAIEIERTYSLLENEKSRFDLK